MSYRNVLLKGLALFVLANLVFSAWSPLDSLGHVSAYNHLFPGRQRLPYGDRPDRAYNLSLYNLEAMFASHEIARQPQPAGEFRVILIGDSSTWGFLLPPEETLSAHLNMLDMIAPDGRKVRFYNLGYPVMSLTKDALLLSYAMRYEPDLIIWPVTLESFPYDKQLYPPLLQNNFGPVEALIHAYNLNIDSAGEALHRTTWWDRTLIGSRRSLADWFRLQLYGVMWAATGIDQDLPADFTPRQEDLPADLEFHSLQQPLKPSDLGLDILNAGHAIADSIPVLLVNEPMFISHGANSDVRYNYYYPRWAYDSYRSILQDAAANQNWRYLDAWDIIPDSEFTNTAVHLSPEGSRLFAQFVATEVQRIIEP